MKLVTTYSSPNHFNGRKDDVTKKVWKADIIVFHQTGGDTLSPALNWYMNSGAQCSPNWLIDKDGTIYQLVHPDNAAWCNGTNTKVGDAKYYGYALSSIVKSRSTNCNLYSYSAEFVHCGNGIITDAQVTAAVELIQNVIMPHMKKNGVTPIIDREHIIGHSDVTPKTRDPEKCNCPGRRFPFDEIIKKVLGQPVTPIIEPDMSSGIPVRYIYQAISQAAIRLQPSKAGQALCRVVKYNFYPADWKNSAWFEHAGTKTFSKLNDGGSLFAKVGEYEIKTSTAKLNIRVSPTLQSDILTVVNKDTKLYVWKETPKKADGYTWYKIVINNKVGYVAGEYIQ